MAYAAARMQKKKLIRKRIREVDKKDMSLSCKYFRPERNGERHE